MPCGGHASARPKKTLTKLPDDKLAAKWEAVSKRRNRIEEEIRGALYHWAMRLNSIEWNEGLRACLSEKRIAELGSLTRQEAFSRNKSPLYFIELLKLLRRSGEYNDVEHASVFPAMDIVNRCRIDAHAKDIDNATYHSLVDALNVLENVFVPPP